LQFTNEADKCTNNIVECEATLLGLCKLRAIGGITCTLPTNSKVIVSQIEKERIAREPTLERYLALIRRMETHFEGLIVEYIERSKNLEADESAKLLANNMPLLTDIFFQVVLDSSTKIVDPDPKVIDLIEGEDWRSTIIRYLHNYYKPDNATEHIKMY
jgi:hypothetical protein